LNWGHQQAAVLTVGLGVLAAPAQAQLLAAKGTVETVVVTARLRPEDAQTVPLSLSVVNASTLEVSRTDNTNQLQLLAPSLNYGSPNPRNTSYTIRGLGSSVVAIAQSNDGLEPGVGFYVDGVYHARPATAAFDFTDIDRIEILRVRKAQCSARTPSPAPSSITTNGNPASTLKRGGSCPAGTSAISRPRAMSPGPISQEVAFRLSGAITQRGGVLYKRLFEGQGQRNRQPGRAW